MAQPNKSAKTMSSRLLTMKFMQRAAASSPSASPSSTSPHSQSQSLPHTPSEPAAKKQRLSNGSPHSISHVSSPANPASQSDAQAIEEALAAEEQKHTEAVEREAANRGETKWYLSFQEPESPRANGGLKIVEAGYGTLDADRRFGPIDEDGSEDERSIVNVQGRRSFGKFNRKVEKQQNLDTATTNGADAASSSDSSDSDNDSDSDDGDEDEDEDNDPTGASALISQARHEASEKARADRKAKRKAEQAESLRLAEERRRRQKRVKLNELESLSGRSVEQVLGRGATESVMPVVRSDMRRRTVQLVAGAGIRDGECLFSRSIKAPNLKGRIAS